ncbi:uncharacterized protein FSUBG_2189 [Fusarium subglutinans]|uniref:Uncharacterized protein n=1 Tax=Gibberella subglutinans TaxID=42677 RepID=A0A8H5QC34_GIBSU|nr:uncharacterized protein FSUBG_2189 [Fusarium subglutinans]KAF5611752.1 hypothetical protein FSUBG_2189 [Fusarium subglutinans]
MEDEYHIEETYLAARASFTDFFRRMEDLGFQSLARIEWSPEWHQSANYNIVHPGPGELDRMPFRDVIESPYWDETLNPEDIDNHEEISTLLEAAVEKDEDTFHVPTLLETYNHFVIFPRAREWLEKLFDSLVEPKLVPVTARSEWDEDGVEIDPKLFILAHAIQLLRFAPVHFRRSNSHKTTDSYTRRFPIGFPQPAFNRPSILGGYSYDDVLRALLLMFLLSEQRATGQLLPLLPSKPKPSREVWLGYRKTRSDLCQPASAGSSTSNQSSISFMKFPPEVRLMIIESALPTQIAPCINGEDAYDNEEGTIRFRAIHATHEDTLLPLKLSCRYIYNAIRQLRPVEAVDGDNNEVIFRFDFKQDTLRVFDYEMPFLRSKSGRELPLPVQKLMVMTDETALRDPIEWEGVGLERVMNIHRFPWLKEFSMVCPVAKRAWRIKGFERIGPVIDIHRNPSTELWGSDRYSQLDPTEASLTYATKGIPAHTGIKWKFNYHYNYVINQEWNTPQGEYLGAPPDFGEDADNRPDGSHPRDQFISDEDNRAFIPYIGFYGYDRGQCSMGGNWAGFRYFEETGAVFFTPLSWDDVEPLVVGPHGENGEKAPWNEHHPQFVARVWIIRKGESVPEGQGQYGWMRVEEVMDGDPEWKQQLKSTWMMVRDTFEAEYHHDCGYEFRDTRF